MKARKIPILPILLMLGIAAAGYGIYKNVEFEEIEYLSLPSQEVINNPMLAAARLLKETQGFTFELAENRNVFSDLESGDTGVLWLANLNELEDKREAENVLQWMKDGGVLLASPAGNNVFDDSTIPGWLMSELGIVSLLDDSETRATRIVDSDYDVVGVELPDDASPGLAVTFFSDYEEYFYLSAEDDDESRTIIDSPHLIHRAVGKGYFALYSDEDTFANAYMDDYTQDYLLLWLTQPAKHKTLTIVHRPANSPGLFSVIWTKFTLAICILGIALVGFLRWASMRLGPIEQELPPIKNNLIAHLEARGTFWRRHKFTGNVLTDVRQAAIEKLLPHRKHSGSNGAANLSASDRAAIVKLASEQLNSNPRDSEKILFGESKNDAAVLRTSKALQKILHRNQLKP